MKKHVFILLFGLISVPVFSQDYYTGKETVSAEGITFNVEFGIYGFSLVNVNNELTGASRLYYKDGRPLEGGWEDATLAATIPGGVNRAFIETFSQTEVLSLRGSPRNGFTILYAITPEGDTAEVSFSILQASDMLAIPPSKFAQLEKNLKKYVKWEVMSVGKQLKFIHGLSFANFSKMELRYSGDPHQQIDPVIPEIEDPNKPGFYKD